MLNSMIHWNRNQVCVLDTETTGLLEGWHEIIQISLLPLDSSLNIRKDIMPFNILMQPKFINRIEETALRVNKIKLTDLMTRGFDQEKAINMLEEWMKKLELPPSKWGTPAKIMLLGHNTGFDIGFVKNWLGVEQYNEWFDYHYRDTMVIANYLNDRAAMHAQPIPFPSVKLTNIAKRLNIDNTNAHDSLFDCVMTAQVYQKMVQQGLIG